jgi:hypothetical protein
MKIRILLAALCLGILVGVVLFTQPEIRSLTGTATFDCYVENQPCECTSEHCVCGNATVPASYCSKKV